MTVADILEKMTDTADPVNGSVFEKKIDTDIVSFDSFIKTVYKHVDGKTENVNGTFMIMYYGTRNDEYHLVGKFNFDESIGYFGGSRIGSENPWGKQRENPVINPFTYRR